MPSKALPTVSTFSRNQFYGTSASHARVLLPTKNASANIVPPYANLVACTSLARWGAVVFGGILIAFVNQGH